jgi:hypothetical protein
MKNLKESLLADIETSMSIGDDIANTYKEAKKDLKKLLNKTSGKTHGQYYEVNINSQALAHILGEGIPAYDQCIEEYSNPVDNVSIIFNIDDVFGSETRPRHAQININTKLIGSSRYLTVAGAHLNYAETGEKIPNEKDRLENVTVKEAYKILVDAFKLKYNDLDYIAKAFKENIKFTKR